MVGEIFAAMNSGRVGYNVCDRWESDRAGARTMQSLITIYYATGRSNVIKSLARRYWLGYSIFSAWRFGQSSSIDKLDFIDVVNCYVANNQVYYNSQFDTTTWPENPAYTRGWMPGNLRPRSAHESPYFYPWQSGFVAVTYYQLHKMFEDLYPDGAYCSIDNNDEITLNNPGGNSFPISKNIALAVSRDLAATVINHCTWRFGPDSPEGRYMISCAVTATPTKPANNIERLNECWPIGGVVRGSVSGTTAFVWKHQMGEPWDWRNAFGLDDSNVKFGKMWLRDAAGPGFINNGTFITEELVCVDTGYSSRNYNPDQYAAYANIGWYGIPVYCIDRNGTARFTAGNGANYRKPLTKAQIEETRAGTYWNGYSNQSPVWCTTFRDYGIWQSAAATIVLDGIRNNYYVTNDAVNYSLAALEAKATSIMDAAVSIASVERGDWDQSTWPYIAYKENFRGLNNPNKTIATNNLFISTAQLATPEITVEFFVETKFDAKPAEAFSQIPMFTVFDEQVTNINIKPREIENYKQYTVAQIRLDRDYSPSSQDLLGSTADLPQNSLVVVFNPVTSIVNVVINLAMDRPIIERPPVISDPLPSEIPSDGGLGYPDPSVEPEFYGIATI
jgi:hypothetical protein